LSEVLYENLILTLLGGIVGLAFSYVSILMMKDWLLGSPMGGMLSGFANLNGQMLLQPSVFIYAFLFCLVLNLLSAGVPAWKASRSDIVNALNNR